MTDKLFLYDHGPSAGQDPGVPHFRQRVTLAGISAPEWVEETDAGRLLVIEGQAIHEFSLDAASGSWLSSNESGMNGRTGVRAIRMTKNRSSEPRFVLPKDHPDLPHLIPQEVHVLCVGDLDADGSVAFGDLLIVLTSWGPCEWLCAGDADEDQDVDFSDVLTVLTAWGPCP